MKLLRTSSYFALALTLSLPASFAQEGGEGVEIDPSALVLLGAVVSASVSADQIVFANLGNGTRSIIIGPDGVIVVQGGQDVDTTGAFSNANLDTLSEAQRRLLVSELQSSLGILIAELQRPGTELTEQDVTEVVKFLLSVGLPWDEGFFAGMPEVINLARNNNVADPFNQIGGGDDTPGILEPEPEPTTPPVVVTPPVTPGPYFAP